MNSMVSCVKRLCSNLICIVLLVVIIVSWKAADPYRANDKKIAVIAAKEKKAHWKISQVSRKIEFQKKRKEELKKDFQKLASHPELKNFPSLMTIMKLYVQNDINGLIYQQEGIEAFMDSYAIQQRLVLARSQTYLTLWEKEFQEHWLRYFIAAALTVFLTPFLIASIMYYGIGFWVEKRKADIAAAGKTLNNTTLKQADARVRYVLESGRHLYLRAGWCKERKDVKTKTKLLWQWKYPLVSFAADLCELIDFSAEDGKKGEVLLTAPVEDLFLGRLELNGGELVMRPRFLVGVTDSVSIRTHWDFSVHSVFSGRVRKIILYGTGTVFLAGSWGIDQRTAQNEEDHRIESKMLLGYDSRARYSLCRTETFWHYFRGKADLFDIKIREGLFLTQNNAWSAMKTPGNNVEAVLKFFFDGIFSILGL